MFFVVVLKSPSCGATIELSMSVWTAKMSSSVIASEVRKGELLSEER